MSIVAQKAFKILEECLKIKAVVEKINRKRIGGKIKLRQNDDNGLLVKCRIDVSFQRKWNAGTKQKQAGTMKNWKTNEMDGTATLNHGGVLRLSASFIVVDMAQLHHSGNIFLASS